MNKILALVLLLGSSVLQAIKTAAVSPLPFSTLKDLNTEQHLVIDWTRFYTETHLTHVLTTGGLEVEDVLHVNVIPESYRLDVLSRFYMAIVQGDPVRGAFPFTIYLVRDKDPRYEYRVAGTRALHMVNVKTFSMKQALRKLVADSPFANVIGQGFHVTDHICETKNNLRALGFFNNTYRKREFSDMSQVFEALNSVTALTYVVLRNFENLPDDVRVEEHMDVDILVSDYFLAKRILDGDGYYANGIDMVEDGGDKVLNIVTVGGEGVMFDIRYVGDNYYDGAMERAMLSNRVPFRNFFVPHSEDLLYSMLYHALIHKPVISNTYKKVFAAQNIWDDDRKKMMELLQMYLDKHGYRIVPPSDKLVGYYISP